MDPEPPKVVSIDALVDICVCFGQNCDGELDPGGRERLIKLFRDHIEKGLGSVRGPSWEQSRAGVLGWVEIIAREAEEKRRGGTVTADILVEICGRRIREWTDQCFAEKERYGPFCPVPGDAL